MGGWSNELCISLIKYILIVDMKMASILIATFIPGIYDEREVWYHALHSHKDDVRESNAWLTSPVIPYNPIEPPKSVRCQRVPSL